MLSARPTKNETFGGGHGLGDVSFNAIAAACAYSYSTYRNSFHGRYAILGVRCTGSG